MSIETIYAKQFADNIQIGVQQLVSKFRDRVLIKTGVKGKATTFEVIGSDEAREKTARHAQAIIDDPTLNRVTCYLKYYYKARQLDPDDELKVIADPKSAYVTTSLAAMKRAIDDSIITAINGTKYTGETGSTSSSLPASQKIAAGAAGLTLAKLQEALEILNSADVDEDEPKFFAISPKQLTDLLGISQITSADYNTVKTLVSGKVVSFMGFNFVLSNRLNTDSSGNRLCLAWVKSGVGLAIGKDINATVKEGPVKDHNAWQTYVSMFIGATRIEDEKCVEIACVES